MIWIFLILKYLATTNELRIIRFSVGFRFVVAVAENNSCSIFKYMARKLLFLLFTNQFLLLNFLGLPNHCKLEIVQCEQSAVQNVKIALQLENGSRVIGEYSSEDTLDKMLEKAQSKLEGNIPNGHEPVVIYMRKEIVGLETLSKTSLKMLGLAGGSAVLRLIHRNPENVASTSSSIPLTPSSSDTVLTTSNSKDGKIN